MRLAMMVVMNRSAAVLLPVCLTLWACVPATRVPTQAVATATLQPTAILQPTASPEPSATLVPTVTPVAATATALPPTPTQTPQSTRSPGDVRWQVETVAENVNRPWSLNFLPDGRLLFTSRDTGGLSALDVERKTLTSIRGLPTPRIGGEAGTLGMAVDRDFDRNGRIYVCYSTETGGAGNRLSSFTLVGDRVSDERVLLNMPGAMYHNGCRVVQNAAGQLFVSMGEASNTALAQQRDSLGGKILRIEADGSTPSDNPFGASAVWTLGHRNPQGLAIEPGSGLLWASEHGSSTRDEINVIRKGQNYGWPACEGTQPTCSGVQNYMPAVREYERDSTIAISDMVFYQGDAFGPWAGQLLFVSLKTGRLYRVEVEGGRVLRDVILIDNAHGRLRDVTVGPDGFIYFSTDDGNDSKVLRLRPA